MSYRFSQSVFLSTDQQRSQEMSVEPSQNFTTLYIQYVTLLYVTVLFNIPQYTVNSQTQSPSGNVSLISPRYTNINKCNDQINKSDNDEIDKPSTCRGGQNAE